jgi:hypothetical protein
MILPYHVWQKLSNHPEMGQGVDFECPTNEFLGFEATTKDGSTGRNTGIVDLAVPH